MKWMKMKWMLILGVGAMVIGCGAEESGSDCDGAACDGEYGYIAPDNSNGESVDPIQTRNGDDDRLVVVDDNLDNQGEDDRTGDDFGQGNDDNDDNDDNTTTNGDDENSEIDAPVFIEDLAIQDLEQIEVLRTTIFAGLDVGTEHYLETVTLALLDLGIVENYDGIPLDGWEILNSELESCPFVKYYDPSPPAPTGVVCEQMVHLAKETAKQELKSKLTSIAMPQEALNSELVDAEEAEFWYEQGGLSGIEERAVLVEMDIQAKNLCEKNAPSAVESSYNKGVIIGRQMMIDELNAWLAASGHLADYPVMSQPIQVCNTNATALEPAHKDAITTIAAAVEINPLCEADYAPPTPAAANMFALALSDYEKGMKKGIDNEFSLAAVKIFKVIPCNVSDPIVVDLDGDGIELLPIHKGVNFDLWSSRVQAMAWPAADDGFLALDRNENGIIDNGSELFGNINDDFSDGFAQLAELDTNHDGAITADDEAFHRLVVWQDANVDAVTDAGELLTLAQLNVVSLPIKGTKVNLTSGGNPIGFIAYGRTVDGDILLGDAFLHTAPWPRLASR